MGHHGEVFVGLDAAKLRIAVAESGRNFSVRSTNPKLACESSLECESMPAADCLRRARTMGVSWPVPDDITDEALEQRFFPLSTTKEQRPLLDWPSIHRELKRSGVTLQLLWLEYRAQHPEGYAYSRFCDYYRAWEGRLTPTMRQHRRCRSRVGGESEVCARFRLPSPSTATDHSTRREAD
jgi:hypothetical protein